MASRKVLVHGLRIAGVASTLAVAAQGALVQHLDATVSGSVTNSPVTVWADQSGSDNHAVAHRGNVYFPSTSLSASGLAGLDFGSTRNDLELLDAAGASALLDFGGAASGHDGFSVLVAFKVDEMPGLEQHVIGTRHTLDHFAILVDEDGTIKFQLTNNISSPGSSKVVAGDTVVVGVTFDATTGYYQFWESQNGVLDTGTQAVKDYGNGESLLLGEARPTSSSDLYLRGMVGEVKVYNHVLGEVEFAAQRSAMAEKWADVPAPLAVSWRVIPEDGDYPTDDVIVAALAIDDSGFSNPLPVDTANTDCTATFQEALDAVSVAGGGTVFVPVGEYRIDGTLEIDSNVILRGRWREITATQPAIGTILSLYNTDTNAIFTLAGSGCGLRDLTFWHPDQDASNPTSYPFVIAGYGSQTTIENITLVNAYRGIDMSRASMCCLRGIYGSPLQTGLTADRSFAVSRFDSIHFSPDVWAWSGLADSPAANGPHRTYIRGNGTAVHIREMDGFYFSFSSISGYRKGVFFQAGVSGDDPHGDLSYVTVTDCDIALQVEEAKSFKMLGCRFEGSVYGLYGQDKTVFNINTSTIQGGVNSLAISQGGAILVNCTVNGVPNISGSATLDQRSYATVMPVFNTTYEKVRKPARTDLFNVQDYGAVGDGSTDDTAAIQAAVAAANANGGGIVFVPDGEYVMTGNLALATGVELRGNSGGRHVASAKSGEQLGSLLLIEVGAGDAGGTPFITMGDHSGLRGIAFHYPVQADPGPMPHPNPDTTYFIHYPFMVQANGVKNYIIDCFASNPYQAAELNGDDHLVEYTFFGGLRRTYRANNCSGGRIQNCHIKPDFWRDIWLPGNPKDNLGGFKWDVNKELEVFYLNGCSDYSIAGIFNHASHAFMTVDNSSGQTLMISAEQVQQGYTLLSGAETFEFLNSSCNINVIGDRSGTYGIKTFPGYRGFARYYVSSIWGTSDETWAGEDGHLYLQQCYFSGPSNRAANNMVCGPNGAMSLQQCDSSGFFFGFDNQGTVTMQDCIFEEGFVNSAAAEYISINVIDNVYVLADINQDPPQAFGLTLATRNIQMEDALIMAGTTPASVSTDGRRVRAARLTSGSFSLDVTDPDFTDGARPHVEFILHFLVDTACTIHTYYHTASGMKLGDTRTYDGSSVSFWKEYRFSESDARFGSTEDIRIDITGASPLLAKVAVSSRQLPGPSTGDAGYDLWSASYGGPGLIGFETHDYDGDGLANLGEYALDGDPRNQMDAGEVPTLNHAGGAMLYVHPQRSDDTNLIYTVETCTHLVSGVWTNTGAVLSGTNLTESTLDYVTNLVSTAEDPMFIRLKFEN